MSRRLGSGPPEVPNCHAMDDTALENSKEDKDFGVLIDSKPSFEQHIAAIQADSWLYDDQVTSDFLYLRPSSTRGHRCNLCKHGCRLNVRKFSFKLRVSDPWNNLPESIVSAKSINSFKASLDKYWKDSQLMFDPDTYIHELTSAHVSRRTLHPVLRMMTI